MKIALYLGSFNPFHNGHLEVVKTALNNFKMDKVVIVPTMQNPWKKEKVLDIDKRIEIINVFIDSSNIIIDYYEKSHIEELYGKLYRVLDEEVPIFLNKRTYIDSIEKKLIPPYYSYATLHALKNKYCNDEVFVLCGEDTIKDIPNWMHGGTIIEDYNFLVVDRPENSISSTEIRNKVKNGENIVEYVTPSVVNLINKYYG